MPAEVINSQPAAKKPWQPLRLTAEFEYVLDRFESGDHLFITGRAGTGKSTLLQLIRRTTRRRIAVTAPTGIAALNVRGQTIHSFFGFPGKLIQPGSIRRSRKAGLFQQLDTLIIDEVSMVRADLLDRIDEALRINRYEPDLPFGGVQVVVFGDLFQLPPVVANDAERMLFQGERAVYRSPYFFDAQVWQQTSLELIELNEVFRQRARQFVRLLDAVREGHFDYDDLLDLNERHVTEEQFATRGAVTLTTTNRLADQINQRALAQLDSPASRFVGQLTGTFDQRNLPTELTLQLRRGAQVMFVRNDTKGKRYVNGTIGEVVAIEDGELSVRVEEDGRTRTVWLLPASVDVAGFGWTATDGPAGWIAYERPV